MSNHLLFVHGLECCQLFLLNEEVDSSDICHVLAEKNGSRNIIMQAEYALGQPISSRAPCSCKLPRKIAPAKLAAKLGVEVARQMEVRKIEKWRAMPNTV